MKLAFFVLTVAALVSTSSAQTPPPNVDSLMSVFYQRIEHIQRTEHEMPDLAVPIDTGASLSGLANEMGLLLESCREAVTHLSADTAVLRRHFETVALGLPNAVTRLRVLLAQQRVEYLHAYLKCHPADSSAWKDLEAARTDLEHLARTVMLAD